MTRKHTLVETVITRENPKGIYWHTLKATIQRRDFEKSMNHILKLPLVPNVEK
jgi:hypothetical protein